MSDLDQLDRAFEALTHEFARDHGPGAAAAMSTARTRRRTRAGATVVAVAGLAAAVVVGPSLLPSRDPAHVAGSPAELTAGRLSAATDGWTGSWRDIGPTDFDAVEAAMSGTATQQCGERPFAGVGSGDTELDRLGDRVFRAGDAVAITLFVDFADIADASTYAAELDGLPAACGHRENVWLAQHDDKVAVMLMLGLDSPPPTDVVASVDDVLAEALGADESFLHSDGMTSAIPDTSASGVTTSVSGPDVTLEKLRASAAGWPSELNDDGRGRDVQLPCLGRSATEGTTWSTSSQIGDRATITMGGEQDATYAIDSLEEALTSCSSTRWTTHRDDDGLWATSDAGTVVAMAVGTKMAWLEVVDVAPPTAEDAAGVQDLLRRWIGDIVVSTEVTPEP